MSTLYIFDYNKDLKISIFFRTLYIYVISYTIDLEERGFLKYISKSQLLTFNHLIMSG